jgi:dimeric dUTPase (all-alpha-NTP-PPase superfamily)
MSKITILQIADMQIKNNNKTYPSWRDDNLDWETAIIVEAVEAIDSLNWKWWKKQETDILNLKIEMVDILHFLLSSLIAYKQDIGVLDRTLNSYFEFEVDVGINMEATLKNLLLEIASEALNLRSTVGSFEDLSIAFSSAAGAIFNSKQELYQMYVAKNWLNTFRQENGYKDGTYKKIIDGEEDNKLLFKLVEEYGLEEAKQKFTEAYKEIK